MMETTRRFGFTWVIQIDWWNVSEQYGDVSFISLSPESAAGGEYFIGHDEETGDWQLIEMGGAGPGIWDRVVERRCPSPLRAMLEARRHYNDQMAKEEALDQWWAERERIDLEAFDGSLVGSEGTEDYG